MSHEGPSSSEIPKPTKEFFLSEPRSAEIREKSIAILQKMKELMHGPELTVDRSESAVAYSLIQNLAIELREMGITPNMHVGVGKSEIMTNPIMAAEYLAGQLLRIANDDIISEQQIVPLVDEFSELSVGQERLIDPHNSPEKIKSFTVQQSMINMVSSMFDVAE